MIDFSTRFTRMLRHTGVWFVGAALFLPTFAAAQVSKDIDIVVEPQTYRPAFYDGASLPTPGAPVRLVAVPRFASGEFVYTWRVNGAVLSGGPQPGQRTVTINMPMAGQALVTVRAETPDGTRAAETSVTLRSAEPVIAVYEDDPLYGVIPLAYNTHFINKTEATLRAEPYFFNTEQLAAPSTEYSWSINGTPVSNPSFDPRSITLQQSGDGGGATVALVLRSIEGVLQAVRTSFGIEFTGNSFMFR